MKGKGNIEPIVKGKGNIEPIVKGKGNIEPIVKGKGNIESIVKGKEPTVTPKTRLTAVGVLKVQGAGDCASEPSATLVQPPSIEGSNKREGWECLIWENKIDSFRKDLPQFSAGHLNGL